VFKKLLHVTLFLVGLFGTWAVLQKLGFQGGSGDGQVMYFRTADHWVLPDHPTPQEQLRFRLATQVPWPRPELVGLGIDTTPAPGQQSEWFGTGYQMPRDDLQSNVTWRPESTFFICYRSQPKPDFEADECIELHFNHFGMRDREGLTLAKPAGYERVVCLGDSLTLAWGVRREQSWPVLVEQRMRADRPRVEVINGGGTGSAYADEYALTLEHRHGRFAPDVVLVTFCLNDLLVTNGRLCHFRPEALPDADMPPEAHAWWMDWGLLRDMHRRLLGAQALDLDASRDWTQELLDLPNDHLYYTSKHETRSIYWAGGGPQQALRDMHAWCKQHDSKLCVVVWPLLQGLGEHRYYPFTKIHTLVTEFCAKEGIAALDLLPTLREVEHETLWVSPADMHPNARAHELVTPALAAFLLEQLGEPR
jgi:hypothetical protein